MRTVPPPGFRVLDETKHFVALALPPHIATMTVGNLRPLLECCEQLVSVGLMPFASSSAEPIIFCTKSKPIVFNELHG